MVKLLSISAVIGIIVSCSNQPKEGTISIVSDSLSYESITMMQSMNDCDKDSSGCTYIEFTYPKFSNASGVLADSLNTMILNAFGNAEKNLFSPDSVQQDFLATYTTFKKKEKNYNTPWTVEKSLTVLNQNPKWLTLLYNENTFTGGAHPNSYEVYSVIEKSSGRKMILTDFFDSTSMYKLIDLGETQFRSVRGINPNQSLEDAGYWFENNRFQLNNNFYMHEEGITFFYNTYEIGPYVIGSTEITIPANKLIKLMKK
ncbi:MAG: DUF3298 domain-containing protein [Bacteroidota bacterium]